ncbi:MAG TPA: outer membrane beta-barrel family protein, partial [Bacteroidia bacterium]|nr:outer membrane beta-barrel family protein [Bacteroidia bacterium]
FQMGLRAEQTITNGDQITTGQTFSRNFLQLFPNVSVSDSLSANNQLGLSVTRRIDRPTYQQLNPFSLYINPTFYLNGNPYLLPQSSYIAELSDGIKQQYFLTFTYTHTQYPITTVIEPYQGRPNIVKQTEENLSSSDNYAFNATVATQLTKWWTTTTSADAYESHYVANIASSLLSTNRFLWDANTENNISISKKISLELHGFYNSGYDLGYLFLKSQWGAGGGLQMKILQNKGTIKLSATDVFWTNTTVGTTYFTGFNEFVIVKRDTRVITLSFSYHFGGNSQSSLKSKGGAEDEKKRASTTG